jgi:phosphoribosylanthranilate isomerase
MVRIKICGITETSQARAAADAGADYLGLVFAPSRRQISPQKAAGIVRVVQFAKRRPAMAGVFVNSTAAEVNSIAASCRLDWVQLSGDESWEYCLQIEKPVIRVVHISGHSSASDITETVEKGYALLAREKLICLLDTRAESAYGGSGQKFDWQLARNVAASFPVMIAGGLSPQNVGRLIKEVAPWGVDVSSGVETGGCKDMRKIRDFIEAVRTAEF